VRGSEDAASAKAALIKAFKLTDEQATHILDMPLRRLTKMSKVELETEQKSLKSEISNLTALLKSDEALRKKVSEELKEVSAKFATPRRTVIL
jgi:DNA gyrase/topoisomerase IV subunit A